MKCLLSADWRETAIYYLEYIIRFHCMHVRTWFMHGTAGIHAVSCLCVQGAYEVEQEVHRIH